MRKESTENNKYKVKCGTFLCALEDKFPAGKKNIQNRKYVIFFLKK